MRICTAVVVAGLLSLACPAVALEAARPLTGYSVNSWTEWNGTPLGSIYTIAQDREGFLWIGGPSGLFRFDGVRFSDATALGLSPLPASAVMALHVARKDGALWIGFGDGKGVRIVRNGLVLPVTPDIALAASATDLREDLSGNIWASTDRGLFRFNGRWEEIPLAGGVRGQQVYRVHVGRTGTIRVGTRSGLQQMDSGGVLHAVGPQNAPVLGISDDAHGRVWTTDPVRGFRPAESARPPQGLEGRAFYMFHDSRENLWIGTLGQGLWRVYEDPATHAPAIEVGTAKTDSLADGYWCVVEDRENNIWLGTNRGLARLSRHTMTPLVNYGLVRAVEATDTGEIWMGTAGGVMRLTGTPATVAGRVPQLDGSDVTSLDIDRTQALWAATGQTLWRIDGGHAERGPTVHGADPIRSITGDDRGGAWIVDGQGRLFHWRERQLAAFALPAEASRAPVSFVHLDREERLWVAFDNGQLGVVAGDGPMRLFGGVDGWTGGTQSAVNTITEDRGGALWIGTNTGLTRYRNGRFATPNGTNGLSGQLVRAFVADDLGYLWLGIGTSLVRLDPAAFDAALERPGYVIPTRQFDAADGVAGVIFGVGNGGAARASNGRLFFVTGRGVTTVDPQAVDDAIRPPQSPVRIERVIADDQRFDAGPKASLPAGTAHLRIDYTIPALTSPARTRFRYRLVGFDRDWVDGGIGRQALYSSLPAGDYRFVVQAMMPDRVWRSETTTWDFRIAPSFYRTSWFYALCAVALGLTAGGAWRLRVQRVKRELAAVYNERMRLGREIHDTLLQGLAGLALQLDSVEHSVAAGDARAQPQIVRLREQIERYIREVRQSIWDLRSPDPRPRSLVDALGDGVRPLVSDGVALSVDVAGTPRPCPERIEEQLLRIAREAVINAVRHGRAASVSLKLAFDRRVLRLTVADDGCGFDLAAIGQGADPHYGLSAMKERAAAAGGSCTVTSRPGAGTEVTVVLPLLSRWNPQRVR
jgi:signal transduction histidine kinase/ligand-binding sensor domain-containing protein